ncbi:MAG: hypothetical protein AB1640_14340 [bacterium]
MKKSRKKRKTIWKRAASFVVFLGTAAFLYVNRCDLLATAVDYLRGNAGPAQIDDKADLPSGRTWCERPARVIGIPDYTNLVHVSSDGWKITCFRLLDFENRLIVCSPHGLKQPRDIEEIIRKRSLEGRLSLLRTSPLGATLRSRFSSRVGVELPEDAFLLREDSPSGRSPLWTAALTAAVVLFCFSLGSLVRGFRQ